VPAPVRITSTSAEAYMSWRKALSAAWFSLTNAQVFFHNRGCWVISFAVKVPPTFFNCKASIPSQVFPSSFTSLLRVSLSFFIRDDAILGFKGKYINFYFLLYLL